MLSFFFNGGMFMWPLLILAIVIVYLSIKKILDLFVKNEQSQDELKSGINAILFWGGFSVMLGIFAHFLGIYQAMQAIMRVKDISPAIVAGGYSMSLITILSGLFLFMVSAVVWLLLQWRYMKLIRTI